MSKADLAHLCQILSEECNEVGKAASKIGRFGPLSYNPADNVLNQVKLVEELNDLFGVLELLEEQGVSLDKLFDRGQMDKKKAKVLKHMEFSRELGFL